MNSQTPLQHALELCNIGWHLFPCRSNKKPYTSNGMKAATNDPDQIKQWWKAYPNALIGVYCERSGIFALDIDKDQKNDIDGFRSLAELIETAGTGQALLPMVGPVQTTPRGGQHYIFKMPDGVKIPNTAGRLGRGLDLRSNGYICTGAGYTWMPGHEPASSEVKEAPGWLLEKIQDLSEKAYSNARLDGQAYFQRVGNIKTEADYRVRRALSKATVGSRNDMGFWLACQLRDAGIAQVDAEQFLITYAMCVPGKKYTEKEAINSLRSAYRAAPREPAKGVNLDTITTNTDYKMVSSENATSNYSSANYLPEELTTTTPTPGNLGLDDIGNGQRFVWRHGQNLRWVKEWGWLTWNGKVWELDRGLVMLWCKETARSILAEAASSEDDDNRIALSKHARASSSQARLDAMATLAQSEPGINAKPSEFDCDPWLLNCQNGIVDLKNGALLPHDPAAMMTKITACDYDPTATAPLWITFLQRIFAGDYDLIHFVQKAVGYSLTGTTIEQALFFLYGRGANGKSTFAGIVQDLLGDYGMKSRAETLMLRNHDIIPEEVAQLDGVRFMLAAELGEGQRLNESLIKDLTGGDKLRARLLHKNSFEFLPTAKPWLYGNHKPSIRGTDEGIWRRVKLIPFTITIPDKERDKTLPKKLHVELPGILAWAVRGCMAWQAEGLGDPQAITEATKEYRVEQDILAAFLDEKCIITPDAEVTAGALYTEYKQWAEDTGIQPLSRINFSRQLEERGFTTSKRESGTGRHVYVGLGLFTQDSFL